MDFRISPYFIALPAALYLAQLAFAAESEPSGIPGIPSPEEAERLDAAVKVAAAKRAMRPKVVTLSRTIPSPHKGISPLIIPLEKDVETKTYDGADFAEFRFEKKRDAALGASMSVYVGYFPPNLFDEIKKASFVHDQPAQFARERAAWHVWFTSIDGEQVMVRRADLYNTFTRDPYRIVSVTICGWDPGDENAFETAAQKMDFKRVNRKAFLPKVRR